MKGLIARFGMLAMALALASLGRAQWTETVLSPPGSISAKAFGAGGSQQVGYARLPDPNWQVAMLWSGSAGSWVNLNATDRGMLASQAYATTGSQQVGQAQGSDYRYFACLWGGTADSYVNLSPNEGDSVAFGVSRNHQVGQASGDLGPVAALWSGTADSFVNLNPLGAMTSSAVGVFGEQEVGTVDFDGSGPHAALWNGTSSSFVDLQPGGATSSFARGVFDGQQVGDSAYGGQGHAGLWSGTADSWVDLNPAGATASLANATMGTMQVGFAYFNSELTPGVWSGNSSTWVALPHVSNIAIPSGISRVGNTVYISGADGFDAVVWSHTDAVPEPAAIFALGLGLAGLFRRRR